MMRRMLVSGPMLAVVVLAAAPARCALAPAAHAGPRAQHGNRGAAAAPSRAAAAADAPPAQAHPDTARHAPPGAPVAQPALVRDYGRLPISFEPNVGQTDGRVRFLAHGPGYTLFLNPTEAVLAFPPRHGAAAAEPRRPGPRRSNFIQQAAFSAAPAAPPTNALAPSRAAIVRLRLAGANAKAAGSGEDRLPGISNYLTGKDPSKWHTGIPNYAKVSFPGVYRGIDLVYYGHQGRLEYDLVVAAGAKPGRIRLAVDGGGARPRIDRAGDLELVGGGRVMQKRPEAYQDIGGVRRRVACRYVREGGGQVGVALGRYDRRAPLVIDPVLVYSTFLGGSGCHWGAGIAVDAAGDAYVTGWTDSTDFPTTPGAFQPQYKGGRFSNGNAFVAKLDPSGSKLLYSTYLGGSGGDQGHAIAVDGAGDAYVTGVTSSSSFPTTPDAFQTQFKGGPFGSTAFVAKFSFGAATGGPGSGDVDGDGQVTVADAALALQIAVGLLNPTGEQRRAADVDGNGKVTVGDVTLILRKALGL